MPKNKEKLTKIDSGSSAKDSTLLDEAQEHFIQSESYMQPLQTSFDEKEALLIGQPEDSISKRTKSKIFDPRLSTIVIERAARVASQNLKGKAFAVSKDDIGKNLVMNLLIDYFKRNGNEQFSHLIKMRLFSVYSMVYGSMFGLVPWKVNTKTGYIGAEFLLLPIRDCYPQPGAQQINDMDWFDVRNVVTPTWLSQQDPETWDMPEILKLIEDLKTQKGTGVTGKVEENKSYVSRHYFPNTVKGDINPMYTPLELYTEYRGDKWITWSPALINVETSKPYLLRTVESAFPDGMLPIVGKHAFPLLDSPIGLGEFERGKTLQYAINSLINLYMDGVKYSIFPPLHINPNMVVKQSIKWGAGEFWFMNNPNKDVQPMTLSPQGLNEFNSTYGFLLAALQSQGGTSDISQNSTSEPTLGKTPEAVKFISNRENARDEWERFMLEESMKEVYTRWTALAANKMEVDVEMRLFGDEIKEIQKSYPDAAELFASQKRGKVMVNKTMLNDKDLKEGDFTRYDYEIEAGSSYKPNIESEQANLTTIMKAVLDHPEIVEAVRRDGKDVDLGELFKQWVIAGNTKNWDKIIVDLKPENPATAEVNTATGNETMPQVDGGQPVIPPVPAGNPVPTAEPGTIPPVAPTEPQAVPVGGQGFNDPDIARAAAEFFGVGGIPSEQFPSQ